MQFTVKRIDSQLQNAVEYQAQWTMYKHMISFLLFFRNPDIPQVY